MKYHIIQGIVTDEDVAKIFSDMIGATVSLGDPEYRVTDDPVSPGWSADFPTRDLAICYAEQLRKRHG